MTVERDPTFDEGSGPDDSTDAIWAVTGRAMNLPFLKGALRRHHRAWVGCALVGLAIGAGYHAVVPIRYSATATLYLAHAAGSDNTVVAQNDLAMLDTAAVGDRALAILGTTGVTATKFLGKQPGISESDNVLVISMTGSSPKAAVRNVNAVATAYLEFRAKQYRQQNDAVVAAEEQQAADLKTKINGLSAQIAGRTGDTSGKVSTLEAERATATTELTSLQQSIQQDNLDTVSIIGGSRVITPGTAVDVSKKRVFGLDGLTGLVGGLGIGVFLVLMQASLSDRLRRREDLAAVLGAPVVVSVDHVKRRRFGFRRKVLGVASRGDRPVAVLGQYLKDLSVASGGAPVMIVAADDRLVPSAAVLIAARRLAESGRRVVVIDGTEDRIVASELGRTRLEGSPVPLSTWSTVVFFAAPLPWEDADGVISATADSNVLRTAEAVFVIASFEASSGAWHLRKWSSRAVVTVSSGTSTIQKIVTFAELLDAAGIEVRAGVLLNSDPTDDSPGLPVPGFPAPGLRLGVVRTSPSEAS